MTTTLISALVTLFVVIDPIGLEACIIAFIVLAGSALFGDWLLAKLGISLAAFRIAGGLLLFAIAFEMVFERRVERKADQTGSPGAHIAAFPLAIPLMAGPGAITAMVLLAGRMNGALGFSLLITAMASILVIAYAVFLTSSYLERLLGAQGQAVFGRLLGVMLAALAVQYVADGILTLSKTLT